MSQPNIHNSPPPTTPARPEREGQQGKNDMGQIEITQIELLALKKLAVICGALAKSLPGQAEVEQTALTRVLIDVVNRAEVANATAR